MQMLSRPVDQIQAHYSAVVIGSGYGGAIAAARIARAGRDVCVLERGKELHPGEYPNTALSAAREIQVHTAKADHGSPVGLFDFTVGPDVTVLTGCGLGGTSLINASVALEPSDAVFADDRWPAALRGRPQALRPFMQTAREMLGSTPYPRSWPDLPKLQALERAAAGLGRTVALPDLNVTFADGPNAVGVRQNACTLCGDCCSGCNYGAKNTMLMNYLPDAYAHGAHIVTEVAVRSVRRCDGRWRVAFDALGGGGRRSPGAPPAFVTADVVVLAAGALGSTQILLRSRDLGLSLSDRLGDGFSGNGDVLAFAYDTDRRVNDVGLGGRAPGTDNAVGPCITGLIDLRGPDTDVPDALIIEDGAIPGALASVIPLVLCAAAEAVPEGAQTRLRELAGIPFGPHRGPVGRTLTYLVMSTDDAGGRITMENDRIQVVWPEVGQQPAFARDNRVLAEATRALHGIETPDPLWAWTNGRSLISVHPLGGCAMADDADRGVVDDRGRVFDPAGGGVHDGLYVCDGSVLPCALDANPSLTIAAIAERTAEELIRERGWTPSPVSQSPAPTPEAAAAADAPADAADQERVRLQFSERLTGFVAMDAHGGYTEGYDRGRDDDARVELLITIEYDDFRAVLADPAREAGITGTVLAPRLSARRLTVTDGRFTLFEPEPSQVGTWHMRYRMTLESDEGKRYSFEGHKVLREDGMRHAWSQTTTLYTKIGELGGAAPGTGILYLKPADLPKLLRSIKVDGAPRREQGSYRRAFLGLFAHQMVRVYGGVLDEAGAFPSAPKTAPTVREPRDPDGIWWCDGRRQWHADDRLGDDAFLRLTRYRAGDRGPLLMATGFGMSSHSFLASTIEQNLTEFLAERGYDIWLFDYRAGVDLPSARTEFTIDDIARVDWPLAVRQVQEITGREDLQAFGHCVGSGSLLMGLLSGLPGIRAAVCAQFPLHPTTSAFNRAKSRLHTAGVFAGVGIGGVSPDIGGSAPDELLDIALRTLPMPAEERCGQAVCRWINAIYGCTHRHAQLNDATHRALNEMFGFGNIDSLQHLSLMLCRGLAVTHVGGMDYFADPQRAAGTSILLLQGEHNYIFHPLGSLKTLRWLTQSNSRGDYHREVLPAYAHLDAIVGSRAAVDVYPRIADFLDRR